MQEEVGHFFITKDGKPRYFIPLTLQPLKESGGFYGRCPEIGVGTASTTTCRRPGVLIGLVQLHLNDHDMSEYITKCGVPMYPIPHFIYPDGVYTVFLAEPVARV